MADLPQNPDEQTLLTAQRDPHHGARDYHRRFVKAAKDHLDSRTFDTLHKKAMSSAGGAAPRKAAEPSDEAAPSLVNKSAWAAITDMWAATVKAVTGGDYIQKDAPAAAMTVPHVDEPIGAAGNLPRKIKKKPKGKPLQAAKILEEKILKAAPTYEALGDAIAEADGVEAEGFAVQLGIDRYGRELGALAIDAEDGDDYSLVHDLATDVPLQDACADVVYITKAAVAKYGHGLLHEAKRIAKPDAIIRTDIDPPKDQGGKTGAVSVKKAAPLRPGRETVPLDERLSRCTDERRELVVKALNSTVSIAGLDTHEQIMYGAVLVPNEEHYSHDYLSPADIRHTAHGYMQHGRLVSSEHRNDIDADVIESFIAPVDLHFDGSSSPYGPQTIPKDSWVAAIKIHDPAEWSKVMSGEYTGFSTGGWGNRGEWEDNAA